MLHQRAQRIAVSYDDDILTLPQVFKNVGTIKRHDARVYLFEAFPAGYRMGPSAPYLFKFFFPNLIAYLPFIFTSVDTVVALIKCFRKRGVDVVKLQNTLHHSPRLFCAFQPRTIRYVYHDTAQCLCRPPRFEYPLRRKFNVTPTLPLP